MGLTQAQLGDLVYVSEIGVQSWERGIRHCPPALFEYLCLLHSSPAVRRLRSRLLGVGRRKALTA
jgi:hypothetical protein